MKITNIYVEQELCNDTTINIEDDDIKKRLYNIETYVNECFLSLDVIKLLARGNVEKADITF